MFTDLVIYWFVYRFGFLKKWCENIDQYFEFAKGKQPSKNNKTKWKKENKDIRINIFVKV